MKKRDKRKRAKRHQIAKSQQIVEEILETEKLKTGVAELEKYLLRNDSRNYPDSFHSSLTKWAWLQGGGGRKSGSEN